MLNKLSESTGAVSRRRFFGGAVVGAAAMLSASEPVWADDDNRPNDPFIVLLKGRYHPAPQLPDLGLSGVNGDGKQDIALTGSGVWGSVPVAFANFTSAVTRSGKIAPPVLSFTVANLPIIDFAGWAAMQ